MKSTRVLYACQRDSSPHGMERRSICSAVLLVDAGEVDDDPASGFTKRHSTAGEKRVASDWTNAPRKRVATLSRCVALFILQQAWVVARIGLPGKDRWSSWSKAPGKDPAISGGVGSHSTPSST
ncbi:hypothetical protein BDK51DRAFT_43685 [Blyttiomyces helicus]|uniref:Uncharacterized protein n=1 Tax=Blyttiomyces helicus TaxID=388810 RepID=A0A4P9VWR8_9FUNG|nr:hypothetical protein BDK51DRAFT_43685 [Blyttiomyces helicus]|eukprot:RKO84144.1 hypothetical protein BDK51DRAFT_43685 [Blyttiomyces helicus]